MVIASRCALLVTQTNNGLEYIFYHVSPFLVLVKKYLSRINLEILILHFENKNIFDVSLKQFAFVILQLPGYFFSWKGDDLFLCR
jgi:hypothetical protein